MICPFIVGQKVVCINGIWYQCNPLLPNCGKQMVGPKEGCIYTILLIEPGDLFFRDKVYLTLKELADNAHYESSAFRPLNERPAETSIEVFKKLLDPSRKVYTGKRPVNA